MNPQPGMVPIGTAPPPTPKFGEIYYNSNTCRMEVFMPEGWRTLTDRGLSDARVDSTSWLKDEEGRALLQMALSSTDPEDLRLISDFFIKHPDAMGEFVRWIVQSQFGRNLKGIKADGP